MTPRQRFRTGLVATVVLALCCFTPILFIAVTAVGLSALAGWLDDVLLPALAASIVLTLLAWRRCRQDEACAAAPGGNAAAGESRP